MPPRRGVGRLVHVAFADAGIELVLQAQPPDHPGQDERDRAVKRMVKTYCFTAGRRTAGRSPATRAGRRFEEIAEDLPQPFAADGAVAQDADARGRAADQGRRIDDGRGDPGRRRCRRRGTPRRCRRACRAPPGRAPPRTGRSGWRWRPRAVRSLRGARGRSGRRASARRRCRGCRRDPRPATAARAGRS